MTYRSYIYDSKGAEVGYIQVDPYDWSYTGPDPEGEVKAFFDAVSNGEFDALRSSTEQGESHYDPENRLYALRHHLTSRQGVYLISPPEQV